jgi:hypothetical protein
VFLKNDRKDGLDRRAYFFPPYSMPITDPKQMSVPQSIKQRLDDVRVLVCLPWISKIHPSFRCIGELGHVIVNVTLSRLSLSFDLLF